MRKSLPASDKPQKKPTNGMVLSMYGLKHCCFFPIGNRLTWNSAAEGDSMRLFIGWLCLLLANLCGCSQHQTSSSANLEGRERMIEWPNDWSVHVGQTVTLEGKAANAKLGAILKGKQGTIWIDGLDSWPEGYYSGGDNGKHLIDATLILLDADFRGNWEMS